MVLAISDLKKPLIRRISGFWRFLDPGPTPLGHGPGHGPGTPPGAPPGPRPGPGPGGPGGGRARRPGPDPFGVGSGLRVPTKIKISEILIFTKNHKISNYNRRDIEIILNLFRAKYIESIYTAKIKISA